ncbi:glycoside hydrolase [candidate division KSB3 bacterium]|nr:glycoside hydrolase [candidate division KSB3 bacterium]
MPFDLFQRRWGLFLHYGIYSNGEYHEQEQWRRDIPREECVAKYFPQFTAESFNADAIVEFAQKVGMEYLVITTKHHDGFCLWDTALTDYNAAQAPAGRDLIRELSEACAQHDFPLGFYYSVADWHHPNYPNRGLQHELPPQPQDEPDVEKYMEYLRGQVEELCSNYGPLTLWWWDINRLEVEAPDLNDRIRELQPGIKINCRGFDEGDFDNAERERNIAASQADEVYRPVEACTSVGWASWGWRRLEVYYTPRKLMQQHAGIWARDGNFLLNIGPTGDGRLPEKACRIVEKISDWRERVREAFQGTRYFEVSLWGLRLVFTYREDALYQILLDDPMLDGVVLPHISETPTSSVLLNNGEKCHVVMAHSPRLASIKTPVLHVLDLPAEELANEVMVIRHEMKKDAIAHFIREISEGQTQEAFGG